MHRFKFTRRNTEQHAPTLSSSSSQDGKRDEEGAIEIGDVQKQPDSYVAPVSSEEEFQIQNGVNPEAQDGVKTIEAITATWSKKSLAAVYIFMWLLYFVNAFQSSLTGNLSAFVLSDFSEHSLIPLIQVVSNVMCAAVYLPVAKILDIWGRSTGFVICACTATLGLVLMAVTNNVETYCAATVFYNVGFVGVIFSVDIITADTSSLRDRGLAYAFTSSPYIITALAGPAAAQGFYDNISWRWAFGTFAIILPFVAGPFFVILLVAQRRAEKAGVLIKKPSGRTWYQSIVYYLIEFDALGIFLLAAGLVIFLLPFSLSDQENDSWASASIISMLVIGFVLLCSFVVVEKWFTKKPFIPYNLLVSRTVLGAVLLCTFYQIAYYCWGSYFSSYLQVVNNLTITQAGWVLGVYDMISGAWLLIVGYLIRRTGRYRWLLLIAVPLYTLGCGLMIYFRRPHTNIGYIIMCQIFIAFAGATITLGFQVAICSVSQHGEIAAALALIGLFGYIGGAIGNSISGAVWTNTLPQELAKRLPAYAQADLDTIYGSLDVQLSYPMGDPVREAIIQSYGVAQERMLIASTAVMAAGLFTVFLIKNNKVTWDQIKGNVF